MRRAIALDTLVIIAACVCSSSVATAQQAPQRIAACSLLPKAEVKKHIPWNDIVDSMAPEEEPIGAAGSSCNYPSVFIQVIPVARLERGQPGTEKDWQRIDGVGDEAWFRPNRTRYAGLLVKTAKYTLTIQASANGDIEGTKPKTISLAKALLEKLPH